MKNRDDISRIWARSGFWVSFPLGLFSLVMTFSHVSSDQRIESLIRGLAILAAYLLSGSFLGFMGGAVWEVLRLTRRSALSILFRIMTFGVMTGLAMWGIMFPLLRHGEGQGFEIVFAISAAVYAVFIAGLAEFLSRGKY